MGMSTLSAATSAFTVSMLSAGGQSMRMTSKASRLGCSAWRSLTSRPIGRVSRRTSAAVRSWLAGSSMKSPSATGTSAAASSDSPSSTSQAPRSTFALSMPLPMVALPCGSRSMSSTRRLVAAREAARLTAVVVLPTPPFWFAMAMTRFMGRQCTSPPPRGRWMRLRPAPLGAQATRGLRPVEPLARHLVRHRVRGAILAPRALEDLRQPRRNALNIGDDLLLGGAAVVLACDADDAAGIDHVVRGIEDAGRLQRLAILALRQLVVRGPGDDARAQPRDRLRGQHRAQRTRGEHVDLLGEHLLDRHGPGAELLAHPLHRRRAHVGDAQLRARPRQQAAQVVAHATHALNGDGETLQILPAEPEADRGLDTQVDPESGLGPRIHSRPARLAPEARDVARRARH